MSASKAKVTRNKYGFYTLADKPTQQELSDYYQKKYYQADEKYSSKYTEDELKNIQAKFNLKYEIIKKHFGEGKELKALDIGAGEGWTLKFLKEKNWEVKGIDFSDFGIKTHNPNQAQNLQVGDVSQHISKLIDQNEKFDLIWLDNVLEHVPEPEALVKNIQKLANTNALLVIEVPNDFSPTQVSLLENGYVDEPYWIIAPDHISYFNSQGLNSLCDSYGWQNIDLISDFPIDFFLFNKHTNYIKNKEVGKECHYARTRIENFLSELEIDKTLELYRSMARSGLGRQIIGFYKTK